MDNPADYFCKNKQINHNMQINKTKNITSYRIKKKYK